jgi:hypothetical protein
MRKRLRGKLDKIKRIMWVCFVMFTFKKFKFVGFLFCLVNVIGISVLKEQRR